MKTTITFTDELTGKTITKKYKLKTDSRIENKVFTDFIETFSAQYGVQGIVLQGNLKHDEETPTTLTDVVVNTPYCRFQTEEWNLEVIPYNDNGIEIYKIESAQAKSGNGTKLMNMVLDIADELGIQVNLVPVPFTNRFGVEGIDMFKLKTWYTSFGFKSNKLSKYLKYN